MALSTPVLVAVAAGLLAWSNPLARADSLHDGNAAFDAGRYADAREAWSAAAAAGNAEAEFDLGLLYDVGNGVPESATTAFHWYERAAEAGFGPAALDVGVMYDSGRGVALDRTKAAIWYARAAALGQAQAAFNLGQLYELGEGVPPNTAAAIAWYRVAAAAIPEAAIKASALAAERLAGPAGALVSPQPAWPAGEAAVASSAHGDVQLVWTAPAEPHQVTYFVEVQGRRNGSFNEVLASYVTTSALAVTLPGNDDRFAWRVYAVAADGSSYAPSPWVRFGTAVPAPSGSPPPAAPP